jgi:hypothetical protein
MAQAVAITLVCALIWTRASPNISAVAKQVAALEEARRIERALKRKKNPALAIHYLHR